jgi:beta-lactamase superfamily II metal-dependent hydrolase
VDQLGRTGGGPEWPSLDTPAASSQELRIYHIDVELGAASLFVAPGGKTLLVDCGKNGEGSRVKAVMDQAGVGQIDFFVCTHYHEDHFGGIDDLVGRE